MSLDDVDRRLVAALKQDGRASVSTLAATLGLARGTVRARIDRLIESRAIRRFTVDLAVEEDPETIRAVMTIELKGSLSRSVISSLSKMPEIKTIHSTNGAWDLVAEIRAASLPDFDRVLRDIRSVPGVSNSETSLLLDTVYD
ncbi:MAG: Lrp/AsnC family transcriptional regulator [Pseudomonadota bacterium]